MKAGWGTNKLGAVTTKIGSGATPLGGETAYKPAGISLIRSLNVYDDGFRRTKLARIDDEQADRLSNAVVEPNDVLLNITGASVARCCLAPGDLLPARVNQHVSIIRPVKAKLDAAFLHYMLISKTYKDRLLHTGEQGGSTRQAITKAQIQAFDIEYPESLPEQQRIVGILDEAFEGIATAKANAEKNLQNARAIFESHLHSVFTQRGDGWMEKSLVSLCSIFVDSAHRTPKYQAEGIPALRPRDVVNGKLTLTEAARVSGEEYEIQTRRHRPAPGDIVYSRELSYGWAVVLPESPRVCLSQGMCLFRPMEDLNTKFMLFVLNGPNGRDQAARAAVGTAHPHINLGDIKAYPIPYPTLREQEGIVRKLDSVAAETQHLEFLYQKKLDALEALKKSLLHRAFSGQL